MSALEQQSFKHSAPKVLARGTIATSRSYTEEVALTRSGQDGRGESDAGPVDLKS